MKKYRITPGSVPHTYKLFVQKDGIWKEVERFLCLSEDEDDLINVAKKVLKNRRPHTQINQDIIFYDL